MNTESSIVIDERVCRAVLSVVDKGLSHGLGKPEPGSMCVMAAINYALGREHGDNPETCVGSAVRAFDINLNDQAWSSNEARAKGMRAEAIAKLGSNNLNQKEFIQRLALKTINIIVPIALRAAAVAVPAHAAALESAAVACEVALDLVAAIAASRAARTAADAAYAAAYATDAAAYAAAAADAAAYAAYATDATDAADAAYAADAAARNKMGEKRDSILTIAANLAKDVLVEMGSEGSKYLYLIEEN